MIDLNNNIILIIIIVLLICGFLLGYLELKKIKININQLKEFNNENKNVINNLVKEINMKINNLEKLHLNRNIENITMNETDIRSDIDKKINLAPHSIIQQNTTPIDDFEDDKLINLSENYYGNSLSVGEEIRNTLDNEDIEMFKTYLEKHHEEQKPEEETVVEEEKPEEIILEEEIKQEKNVVEEEIKQEENVLEEEIKQEDELEEEEILVVKDSESESSSSESDLDSDSESDSDIEEVLSNKKISEEKKINLDKLTEKQINNIIVDKVDYTQLDKLKVNELRDICMKKSLSVSGNKATLIKRINDNK
tara:strand:- start:741 stop:1667 length:927 start_codon:yes stop_codon:yes gene_type:complete